MLGRIIVARHGEAEGPAEAQKVADASTLDSLSWKLSTEGRLQAEALGRTLATLDISRDSYGMTGTAQRFRETASLLTSSFGSDLRWFAEEYLNARPRGLIKPAEISHATLYERSGLRDESIFNFITRGPERLQRRIRERFSQTNSLIVVTTSELAKGLLARLEGWPPIRIVQNFLSKNGEYDLGPGEAFEISSRNPKTGESSESFHYLRKIKPLAPHPLGEWREISVPRYSGADLIDPKIWGA